MERRWIVDGYNLIHTCKSLYPKVFSKESLFDQMANFASMESDTVLCVLDGKGPAAELDKYKTRRFEIRYSQEVSADAVIEKMVHHASVKLSVIVVTSDRAIQDMVRGSGARVMDCAEFARHMQSFSKTMDNTLFKNKFESHGFHRPFEKEL